LSGDNLRDAPKASSLASPGARDQLYLVLECDRPLAGGLRCELDAVDEVVIGRAAQRSARRETVGGIPKVLVGVPDRALSATHARLLRAGDEWRIEDLRSTNGSFVNGARTQRQALRAGDVLELGHTLFLFGGDTLTPEGTPEIVDASESARSEATPGLATLVPTLAAELSGLERIARSHVPVLLLGETGTGKEVLARAIHDLAKRAGDFVAVNCAALPASLVEGQLFGACRGAFSGAVRDQVGFVRAADRGTLMLDEIGDLSLAAQAALLRVLQEREVVPLGATRPIRVDVRTIAATHRDLAAMVGGGAFRADLLARLDGFTFQVPPLRARKPDIGLLIASLLRKMAGDAERAFLRLAQRVLREARRGVR